MVYTHQTGVLVLEGSLFREADALQCIRQPELIRSFPQHTHTADPPASRKDELREGKIVAAEA